MKNTKSVLLAINNSLLLFGTTIYCGVLWALHFFWYPSWQSLNLSNVQQHFISPTSHATDFFWIVVPIMFITNVIWIIAEWKTYKWYALLALACESAASYVGQKLIIPINKTIGAGLTSETELTTYLKEWMFLNDVRWVIMTAMWLVIVIYFNHKSMTSK
jgi:hypothetical protein